VAEAVRPVDSWQLTVGSSPLRVRHTCPTWHTCPTPSGAPRVWRASAREGGQLAVGSSPLRVRHTCPTWQGQCCHGGLVPGRAGSWQRGVVRSHGGPWERGETVGSWLREFHPFGCAKGGQFAVSRGRVVSLPIDTLTHRPIDPSTHNPLLIPFYIIFLEVFKPCL
jgi:hypothetical protein